MPDPHPKQLTYQPELSLNNIYERWSKTNKQTNWKAVCKEEPELVLGLDFIKYWNILHAPYNCSFFTRVMCFSFIRSSIRTIESQYLYSVDQRTNLPDEKQIWRQLIWICWADRLPNSTFCYIYILLIVAFTLDLLLPTSPIKLTITVTF